MRNPLARQPTLILFGLASLLMFGCSDRDSAETEPFYPVAEEEWELVWSDEFDGDSLDASGWDVQLGDGSEYGLDRWGNNEQQWYSADNLTVADGNLTIAARGDEPRPDFCCTSGRIRTAGKFNFKYGRVEARIRAADGQGLWNALWMLPTDSPYGGWASSGEIDIMEVINAGTEAEDTWISLHHGFAWPFNLIANRSVPSVDPAGGFHDYAMEWEEDEIRWYIDGTHHMTVTSEHWYSYFYEGRESGYVAGEGAAPFDTDFHILLNLAVGGHAPGPVDAAALPSEMTVDYVRVYRCSYDQPDGGGCNSNVDRNLETPPAQSPFVASFPIYTDGAEALTWTIAGETVERPLAVNSFWDNGGALSFAEVAEDERGMVIEVTTSNSGNISISATDGQATSLFGFGNNPNWWELGAGELKFDLYVNSANTDPDGSLLIKMDSGWPALGYVDLAVAELPHDEWTTISVKVNDLLHPDNTGADPLDTDSIVSFFVLEPTSSAHVKVDNIQLKCGHPARNGCGILPPGGEVDGELVNVFVDEVDPVWTNGIGAWDTVAGADYFDGNSGNHVTWSVMSSGDTDRQNILNVNFGSAGANGVFYIQSAAGIDMSPFATGNLIFDLRLQAGSTHGITYKIDCMYPCTSGDQVLDVSGHERGEWTTVEIPIAGLVSSGLDLTRVNTGIVIFPSWDAQSGVSFDLDNIRWEVAGSGEPGGPVGPGSDVELEVLDNGVAAAIWDEGVGAFDEQIGWGSCFGNGEECPSVGWGVVADDERGDVLEFNYAGPGAAGVFVQASAGMDLSDYAGASVSFDVNVVDAGSNASGFVMKIDCVFPCTSGDQPIGVVGVGGWETVRVPVSQLVEGGLDLTNVNTGLVMWPAFTEQTGVVFRLDDVKWTSRPLAGPGLFVFADQLEDVWELWDCCGGANVSVQDSGGAQGAVAELSFTGDGGTVSGFLYGGDPDADTSIDVSAYSKLEFDARVVSHPNSGDDTWLIKIESADASRFAEVNLNTSVEGQSPVEGEWQHYTFNMADLSGVDWSSLQIIMIFPPWGTAQGALIQIDNVQFTQ